MPCYNQAMTEQHTNTAPNETEQRYRRLLEAVTDYIYHVRVEDGQAVETVHGATCEAVTGYTPEEFAANPLLWIAMVPQEDRAIVQQQAARVLSGQDAPPVEHRICRKDGQVRWVLNFTSPQRDGRGKLIAYDGLLRDITERKLAELALKQLNEELEQRVAERTQEYRLLSEAISHLGEGVLITDDELDWPGPRIRFVNDAVCRITGYTAEELIDNTPRLLQGTQSNRDTLERLKSTLAAGKSFLCEVINYRKDGTPYDAELFITPLYDAGGRRTNFVSIHRDISERKGIERALRASEDRLRAILNAAVDAIVTVDHRGIIVGINAATERMFGYTQDELVGQNVKMLMPPPFRDQHDGYIARYLQTGEAHIIGIGRDVVGLRKDGSTFPVGLAVSEIADLELFTGIVRDISAMHELQNEVLEIAAEEQRRIGHELHDSTQQQLTGLSLLAQNVAETLAKLRNDAAKNRLLSEAGLLDRFERMHERAEQIQNGLEEAAGEVNQLARGLIPVQVDAQGLTSALTDLAARVNNAKQVQCSFTAGRSVEVTDNSIATHLYRIAQEAINNAVKHARANKIEMSLGSDPDRLTLRVADNGIGIREQRSTFSGMGLRIMEYRAGLIGATLQVGPGGEGGTLVNCTVLQKGYDG